MPFLSRPAPRIPAGWRPHAWAIAGYAVLALAFAWPLPLYLSTHLTGSPEGDTGVYVWNQWVFHREILTQHTSPYFTDRIFSLSGHADLTLHNYTTLANLIALPFLASLGVVPTFNLVYLFLTALSGYAMFLLAHTIKAGALEAWLAGAMFAWSPMLVTRGSGHFSLVAAAPLPLFVLFLIRAHRYGRLRDAAGLGIMAALAFGADVYYAVYCVLLAAAYVAWHLARVERRPDTGSDRLAQWRVLDVLIVLVSALVMAVAITGGWVFTLFGQTIGIRELYTPMLVLTILITVRVARCYRVVRIPVEPAALINTAHLALIAGLVAALLLAPVLSAVWARIGEGRFVSPPIYWRSSPAGVDLLAMVLPNPNHPLAPTAWREWLSSRFDGYLESVASIPLIGVMTLFIAWRRGWHPPRMWVALGVAFSLLAAGPFLHVAGVNTYVAGPWALLRYVPIMGLARNPSRLAVLMMLVLAPLFALGLTFIRNTGRPWLRWAIAAIVILELLPIPRPLYSAHVPAIYDRVAADPHDVRVLDLPFGVRDGVSSFGNYTARTQFFQTRHGKPIIGGVLSRISDRRVKAIRSDAMLDALMHLSEGHLLDAGAADRLAANAPHFLARANVGYVVIDHTRASPALIAFARHTLHLEELEADGPFVLYRPVPPPAPSQSTLVR